MVLDDGGAIWLADPWLASLVIVLTVGMVLWSHRWIETGAVPRPRVQAIRIRRTAIDRLGSRSWRRLDVAEGYERSALGAPAPMPVRPRRAHTAPKTAA